MIGLVWNVQGLGNPRTMRTLRSHSLEYKPDFIFMSETKLKKSAAERVRLLVGYDGCFAVERIGRSGGLMLLWKDGTRFSLGSFSRFHIEGALTDEVGKSWNFLGLYGDPVASNQKLT